MAVLKESGDEVQGERIRCIFRKRSSEVLVHQTSSHRAVSLVIKGMPARAVIDKEWELKKIERN